MHHVLANCSAMLELSPCKLKATAAHCSNSLQVTAIDSVLHRSFAVQFPFQSERLLSTVAESVAS